MTAPIRELFADPLREAGIVGLAQRLIAVAANQPSTELEFTEDDLPNRQSQRLIRPLLACLAALSGAETGTQAKLYGGPLCFVRNGESGVVRITGEFENHSGAVPRLVFHRPEPVTALDKQEARLEHEAILATLRHAADPTAVRAAVLASELATFTPDQAREIVPLLHRYLLSDHTQAESAAVSSAASGVRAYFALLPVDRLDESADLFDGPGLPAAFESELAKMITRKLTANPPSQDDRYPAVAERLERVANAYLHPDVLPQPYCGATALNSVLAVALIRTSLWPGVLAKVEHLSVNWFRQQLGRRAGRLADELGTIFPRGRTDAQQVSLRQLAEIGRHAVT